MPTSLPYRASALLFGCAMLGACAAPPIQTAPQTVACKKIADGLQWGEGPCLLADGRLIFADIPAERIMVWSRSGGLSLWQSSPGLGNGHALAPDGSVLTCEEGARRVVRQSAKGEPLGVVCERDAEGRRLNSPNDLCLSPGGRVYFSDPTFGIRKHPELKEQPLNSVFSCRLDGTGLRRETGAEMQLPNGLAFSPDQRLLYVADSKTGKILRYAVNDAGILGTSSLFCEFGADGVRVDIRGRVYLAGNEGVAVYRPDGTRLGLIPIPDGATNLCLGDAEPTELFVTTPSCCYRVEVAWR